MPSSRCFISILLNISESESKIPEIKAFKRVFLLNQNAGGTIRSMQTVVT